MSLQTNVMTAMKDAMKAKDQNALTSLRAIKSEILKAQTETGSKKEISEEEELKLLQKLVKQRKDSAAIYKEQQREDLAADELTQVEVIERFLPEQLNEEKVGEVIDEIIAETGANGMKDMGKVMGIASQKLAGKADGKTISVIVKNKLA